jgi:folate receptor
VPVNYCRTQDKCRKIKDMFASAADFCQRIFDDSFRVTSDSTKCFSFTFANGQANPNEQVAKNHN